MIHHRFPGERYPSRQDDRAVAPAAAVRRRAGEEALGADEWTLADLARLLAMPTATLHTWVTCRWVRARRQLQIGGRRQWVIWAYEAELERLRRHCERPAGAVLHDRWVCPDRPTGQAASPCSTTVTWCCASSSWSTQTTSLARSATT